MFPQLLETRFNKRKKCCKTKKKAFNIVNLSIKDVVILNMINFINPYKCWQYLNEKHMAIWEEVGPKSCDLLKRFVSTKKNENSNIDKNT